MDVVNETILWRNGDIIVIQLWRFLMKGMVRKELREIVVSYILVVTKEHNLEHVAKMHNFKVVCLRIREINIWITRSK